MPWIRAYSAVVMSATERDESRLSGPGEEEVAGMSAQPVRASGSDLRDQFDGRAARPAAMFVVPPARPAKVTAKRANASTRPADPALEGMGRAPAQAAFLFYRNMGPRRSVRKMAEVYQKDHGPSSPAGAPSSDGRHATAGSRRPKPGTLGWPSTSTNASARPPSA